MFSYRHAFHAGNHADVLKHMALLATLRYLTQKEASLTVVDTHAGAGNYRLDSEQALTSLEAAGGVQKLIQDTKFLPNWPSVSDSIEPDAPDFDVLADYLNLLAAQQNPGDVARRSLRSYPGSPQIARTVLRAHDKQQLFELHPTEGRLAQRFNDECPAGSATCKLTRNDGFDGLLKCLPPAPSGPRASRRALVVIDPSYEIKHDYGRVAAVVAASLEKFPTGCYFVWYPIIPKPEAHGLPRKLKTLATQAGKPWLHATLNIGRSIKTGPNDRAPLSASGIFLINPPHTLKTQLQAALPKLKNQLGLERGAAFSVES